MNLSDLQTPALILDREAFGHNLKTMAERFPGTTLRPHVKAHKSTDIAAQQAATGHIGFTCATIKEVESLANAGLGSDLLLANEVTDARRLGVCAESTGARITVAVDSEFTVNAAASGGVREVLIDVNIGLPRCGVAPEAAGRLADFARSKGLHVRGVMGYEGHLMMVSNARDQTDKVAKAFALLTQAAEQAGGEIISGGGTGTFMIHHQLKVLTEVQCGSYVLMDTDYAKHGFNLRQALFLLATVISVTNQGSDNGWLVIDCGLKANGMDHGNPSVPGGDVWFCSDEHITVAPHREGPLATAKVGDKVLVVPAHCDPTVAYHEQYWTIAGWPEGEPIASIAVQDRWPVDMRGW
jgi:D-threonine aldolase